jgi:hypothetical protein
VALFDRWTGLPPSALRQQPGYVLTMMIGVESVTELPGRAMIAAREHVGLFNAGLAAQNRGYCHEHRP